MGAVTVKTNCGRSVSEEVRGGRFAFSTDRDSWEGERETPYSDLARVSLCRGYGIVEYPLSAENSMISGVKYRVTG